LLGEIKQQKLMIEKLQKKLQNDKVFLFMVIHDLKHPTESTISQLEFFNAEIMKLRSTILKQASEIESLQKEIGRYRSEFFLESKPKLNLQNLSRELIFDPEKS